MGENRNPTESEWPVSWEASRAAQLLDMARASPADRLRWLEEALRVAQASGALSRMETDEKRRRRGLR